jgi:hypothetical protein
VVETALVEEIWPQVAALRSLFVKHVGAPLAEALAVSNFGEWRLLTVFPEIESRGTRRIFEALDQAAGESGLDYRLLTHLMLLDPVDPQAQRLMELPFTRSDGPPRRFQPDPIASHEMAWIALLSRNDRMLRALDVKALQEEVMATMSGLGLTVVEQYRLPNGSRADIAILRPDGRPGALVEVVLSDRKNWLNRVHRAAGTANLARLPVLLVHKERGYSGVTTESTYGEIPVVPIDWEQEGAAGVRRALATVGFRDA